MTDTKDGPSLSVEIARALLLHVMEWDSEESWCAGWIGDNENRLWSQVVRDTVVAGKVLDLPQYDWLRELAVVAEGWWVWPHETPPGQGPSFVGMAEWLPSYEAHRQKVIEKYGPGGWAAYLPLAQEENRAFLRAFREEREALERMPKPKAISRETAVARLLRLMEDEAEDNWACSWVPKHEYMLWASATGNDPGQIRGGSSEPARLRELATIANGWFTWDREADEVEFVPMDRWLVMYRQYVDAQKGASEDGGPKA